MLLDHLDENESTVEAALRADGRIVDDDDVGWWFIDRRWVSETRAHHLYHAFERQVIAGLPREDDWEITSEQIDEWLRGPGAAELLRRRSYAHDPKWKRIDAWLHEPAFQPCVGTAL
jgi:hypothetical protein